jgi:hypothetical protein
MLLGGVLFLEPFLPPFFPFLGVVGFLEEELVVEVESAGDDVPDSSATCSQFEPRVNASRTA